MHLLSRTRKFALIVVGVLLIGAAIVIGLRFAKATELAEVSKQQATRYVSVTSPRSSATDNVLRLPGSLQGIIEAPINARTNGYVSRWVKDIGDPVKRGDLLAVIDTPEGTTVERSQSDAGTSHDQPAISQEYLRTLGCAAQA